MTSKEALNKLSMAVDDELLYEQSGILFATELTKIIKKDLERLEKLEEKNEKLSSEIDDLLDDKLVLVVKNTQQDMLITELVKYKKSLEILKKHIEICWQDDGLYTGVELYLLGLKKKNEWIEIDGIDYWELKEVLDNE